MKAYFIKRSKKDLILSEYQDPRSGAFWDENEDLEVYSSHSLDDDEVQKVDHELYACIDAGINRWVQDTKYFPHLFISAFIFLVVYFFFAFVVRDPVPVIDEMALAGLGAALSWGLMVRHDKNDPKVMKKREELKRRAGAYKPALDSDLSAIEDALEDLDRTKSLELSEMAVGLRPDNRSLHCPEKLRALLLNHLKRNERGLDELLEKAQIARKNGMERERVSQSLFKEAHKGSDLALLCLILELL